MMLFKIVLSVLFVLSPILVIWNVGEPRKPLKKDQAVASLLVNGALLWWMWAVLP